MALTLDSSADIGTGLIDLATVVQIQKDAEDKDKKWEILNFYLCPTSAGSVRQEQHCAAFCHPACHLWSFLLTSYKASWSPQVISPVLCQPRILKSSRMGAYLVSSLGKKKKKNPVLSRNEHTRPLFPRERAGPNHEIHFLSSGLLFKSSFCLISINSFEGLRLRKPGTFSQF